MNLNQVTLAVSDIAEACDFYLKLGFTQIVDTPHYARFACPLGDSTFSLSLDNAPFESSTVIYFEVPELDECVAQLKAKDIEFDQDPRDEKYLWREAVLYDPSGNKIKLYWAGDNRVNPPWKVTKNG